MTGHSQLRERLVEEALDEFSDPCAALDRDAEWVAVCRTCRYPLLLCGRHLDALRALVGQPGVYGYCGKCSSVGRTVDDVCTILPYQTWKEANHG